MNPLRRAVSLSPSFTEILQALGEGANLAGVTDHCPQDLAGACRIGSPKALRLEEIARLAPDIVLADRNENRPEEVRVLEKKFRVVSFDVRSVPAAVDAVAGLGRLFEKKEAAEKIVKDILAEQEANRKAAEGAAPVRTLILLWHQPYLTVNFDTYISRLVEGAGGRNVFHEDPIREFPVELEDMIERDPERLLLAAEPFSFRKNHRAGFRKYRIFSKIPIDLVDGRLFSRFGPRTAEALRTLRRLILEGAVHAQ